MNTSEENNNIISNNIISNNINRDINIIMTNNLNYVDRIISESIISIYTPYDKCPICRNVDIENYKIISNDQFSETDKTCPICLDIAMTDIVICKGISSSQSHHIVCCKDCMYNLFNNMTIMELER